MSSVPIALALAPARRGDTEALGLSVGDGTQLPRYRRQRATARSRRLCRKLLHDESHMPHLPAHASRRACSPSAGASICRRAVAPYHLASDVEAVNEPNHAGILQLSQHIKLLATTLAVHGDKVKLQKVVAAEHDGAGSRGEPSSEAGVILVNSWHHSGMFCSVATYDETLLSSGPAPASLNSRALKQSCVMSLRSRRLAR